MPKIVDDVLIFKSAIQAVIERGYQGATTKQIAETAGVSEVTLFRKYNNKAELIKTAIAAMARELDYKEVFSYSGDVRGDLERVIRLYIKSSKSYGSFIHILLIESNRHKELKQIIETPLNMFRSLLDLLKEYQSRGVLKNETPLDALTALMGPLIARNILPQEIGNNGLQGIDVDKYVDSYLSGHGN